MFKLLNKIFVLSLFCISINEIQAQTLSKEDVQKALNYLNCKAILLANQLSETPGVTAKFQEKCDCESNITFDKIKGAIASSEDKTLELSKKINSIVNQKEISNITKDELVVLLTDHIFRDKDNYLEIYDFANKNEPGRENKINDLKSELKKKFEEPGFFSNANKPSKESEEITSNATKNEQTAESGWFSGFSSQMIVISLLLSFIVSLIFFLVSHRRLINLVSKIDKQRNCETTNPAKNDNGSNEEFIQLQKKIETEFDKKIDKLQSDLKNDIKELEINFEKSFETIKKSEPNPVISPLSPPKDTNRTTFYLSMPEGERTFSNQTKHSKLESGRSIYEAIEINSTKAKFRICNNQDSINRALNNLDKCIKTVCDELNPPDGATKIITVADGDGIIELQNDKWIVITKAKIRYES